MINKIEFSGQLKTSTSFEPLLNLTGKQRKYVTEDFLVEVEGTTLQVFVNVETKLNNIFEVKRNHIIHFKGKIDSSFNSNREKEVCIIATELFFSNGIAKYNEYIKSLE